MALLAQPEAASGAAGAGAGASGPAGCEGLGGSAFMMAAMVAVLYFFVLRPQTQQQKQQDAFMKALKAGDKVRTSGGIRGEVVEVHERDVTLAIAAGVKVNVLKSHIAVQSGAAPANESAKDKG